MPRRRTCYAKGDFHFVDVHVGARPRRRRELLGIKVQQLAVAMGVSFQQIQKYESAENHISPSRLYQFARALAVPVAWFFDGLPSATTRRPDTAVPEHELQSRETASLVEAYYRIAEPKRRRAVYRLIQSMAGTLPA
jgi:transcriptional regulator with XRE-family HTH domain